MTSGWTDRIVGERMTVDQEFNDEVVASEFSNQEWDLIMSAVEFEIRNPETPEEARIVANDEKIEAIVPELANIRDQMQAMGGAPGGGGGRGNTRSGGGLFDSVKNVLGMSGDSDEQREQERIEAASALATRYGEELQAHLEAKGRWHEICAVAADQQ